MMQVPCDHLVCAACINSLVNAAAHKPPRPCVCFGCGDPVESFVPAWNGVGQAMGGRLSLMDALREWYHAGDDLYLAMQSLAMDDQVAHRQSSSSINYDDLEAFEDGAKLLRQTLASSKIAPRANLTWSTFTDASDAAAPDLSPLSLKSKRSLSILASGSINQTEYALTSTPPSIGTTRVPSNTPYQEAKLPSKHRNLTTASSTAQPRPVSSTASLGTPDFSLGHNVFSFSSSRDSRSKHGVETPTTSIKKDTSHQFKQ